MGRNKKRRRTQALHEAVQKAAAAAAAAAVAKSHGPADGAESDTDTSLEDDPLSPQNLAICLRALEQLSQTPERIHEKQFKDLRRVLHPLVVEQCKVYQTGVDYKSRVTVALAKQQWSAALEALRACKDFEQIPKQGTIQRWVRDVGNIGTSTNASNGSGSIKIPLLTAILNLGSNNNSSTTMTNQAHDDEAVDQDMVYNNDDDGDYTSSGLNKHDPRAALLQAQQECSADASNEGGDEMKALEILDHWTIPGHCHHHHHDNKDNDDDNDDDPITNVKLIASSKILYQQAAAERKPPNHYDLLLHTTTEPGGCIQFDKNVDHDYGHVDSNDNNSSSNSNSSVQRHNVPFVQGGFVLQNVLSRNECEQFMTAATCLGYRPDHPTSLEHPTGIDSCEWLIDANIQKIIFDRVQSFLPQTMTTTTTSNNNNNSKKCCYKLHSINCRWRFFRYNPESVYRPHIDGSWPESRVNPISGAYETDTSGKTKSFLTFLIYLNQNFDGGQTRFYYSSPASGSGGGSSGMKARGITPSQGCVLVFPQGNTASLLHEGTAVLQGTKLVVRTDVLYSRIAQDQESDNCDNEPAEMEGSSQAREGVVES